MNFKNNLFAIALLAASLTTASPIAATDAASQKERRTTKYRIKTGNEETSHVPQHIDIVDSQPERRLR